VDNGTIEHGRFVPSCRVVLGAGALPLARSLGLEALGLLTAIAALTTPNGRCAPSAPQLSGALGIALPLLRPRLRRLARATTKRGEPVLVLLPPAQNGAEAVRPGPAVLERREAPPAGAATPLGGARPADETSVEVPLKPTRETVEHGIRASQGWPSREELDEAAALVPKEPEDLDGRWAVQRLVREKVDYALAVRLVQKHGADACLQQVRWLGRRKGIKQKSRYLVAAIMGCYAEPPLPDAADIEIS